MRICNTCKNKLIKKILWLQGKCVKKSDLKFHPLKFVKCGEYITKKYLKGQLKSLGIATHLYNKETLEQTIKKVWLL